MGLFDKLFNSNSNSNAVKTYKPLTDYEAWVAILYAIMSVDGDVSDAEIDSLARLLIYKNKFANLEIAPFYKNAALAKEELGVQKIIDGSALIINEDDRPTVFCLAAELVLADGVITDKEKELLEYIANALLLNETLAGKIIEVTLIKNKDNRIFVG
jgi:uncharacterized tellurite resistance protein B-like protein